MYGLMDIGIQKDAVTYGAMVTGRGRRVAAQYGWLRVTSGNTIIGATGVSFGPSNANS